MKIKNVGERSFQVSPSAVMLEGKLKFPPMKVLDPGKSMDVDSKAGKALKAAYPNEVEVLAEEEPAAAVEAPQEEAVAAPEAEEAAAPARKGKGKAKAEPAA